MAAPLKTVAVLVANPALSSILSTTLAGTPSEVKAAREAGIAEIIMKPMSPRYLVERVLARLASSIAPAERRVLRKRDWSTFGDNIVPLFRHEPEARP